VTLAEKEQRLLAELASLPDVAARLAWLIEQARARVMLPVELRVDANRVEGCLSKLWFVAEFRDGRCWFRSESDSLIVKSVAGLLTDFYSGCKPQEIVRHEPEFLAAIGLSHHFTAIRRNAMGRVWQKMRAFAEQHLPQPAVPAK
jgi:cysteine desulfuration protein SufE